MNTSTPHGTAERSAKNDALALRWIAEMPEDFEQRFLAKLTQSAGCLLGPGAESRSAYSRLRIAARVAGPNVDISGHRLMWLYSVGPIPYGAILDHDGVNGCKRRRCVNPEHLSVTDVRGNMLTGSGPAANNSRARVCSGGHDITDPANLTPSGIAQGKRLCLECGRLSARRRAALIREACRKLGITWTEFLNEHGASGRIAQRILADDEAQP